MTVIDDNSDKVLFASAYNYQKIAIEGFQLASVPFTTDTTITIPHSLGFVPTARVWYEPNRNGAASNEIWPLSAFQHGDLITDDTNTIGYAYLDETNLYVVLYDTTGSTVNIPLYWRIYYES